MRAPEGRGLGEEELRRALGAPHQVLCRGRERHCTQTPRAREHGMDTNTQYDSDCTCDRVHAVGGQTGVEQAPWLVRKVTRVDSPRGLARGTAGQPRAWPPGGPLLP